MILANDLPEGFEAKFRRPYNSKQSHGGTPVEFSVGEHHLSILADGKWRAIHWEHKGKTVADVLMSAVDPITDNAVMIAYNPAGKEEQVQLSCDPYPGKFPNQ
ncbi:MAG: hypothetical protein HC883_03610 [Bdellovibrionaceae bacterium]|nr:hypothetical protein [Pseudobdellovibrionaceae bacterium]